MKFKHESHLAFFGSIKNGNKWKVLGAWVRISVLPSPSPQPSLQDLMGQEVKVKKLHAFNFTRGKQNNYCPATQAVDGVILC